MPADKSDKQILNKLERYCAFQERCKQEVSMKLQQLGITDEAEKEEIIRQLEKKRFVDETRYAKAFARDKFNLHQWGKIKIASALQGKNIPQHLIDAALDEIDSAEYEQTLKSLLKKKETELSDIEDDFIKKNRLAAYLAGKGFEADLIWKMIAS
jgi:regulatory protein